MSDKVTGSKLEAKRESFFEDDRFGIYEGVYEIGEVCEEFAVEMVRRYNLHDELVEALRESLEWSDDHPGMPPTGHLHKLLARIDAYDGEGE